ncbi:glycosyltransferase family 9 protein [Fulvivirga sp. 29W222]|uniref:Glycosyltransferase family 9 protein n=1 Tax=Fulvivirga marina TaxID=2494733 RepID=A0A937G4F1_9BACT|nr:glycosyltransferase family 9 protein [Fulvivirga marina]MBL6449805.1 glycosyltransferase family 9 protein [Fulvivirga marina]
MMNSKEKYRPWTEREAPKKVLFIRLQAMGDMVITLPYIQGFKKNLPEAQIDFLTREEFDTVPNSVSLFSNVYTLRGGRSTRKQAFCALMLALKLKQVNYDAVVDLQNNRVSKIIRRLLAPKAWSVFDRWSPIPAGARTENTIRNIGLGAAPPDFKFQIKPPESVSLLTGSGWQEGNMLIVLNPAGFLVSRNWPLHNYVEFGRLILEKYPNAKFLVLGIERINEKAIYLHEQLGESLINLVGKTSPATAFAIMQHASLVLTEDSGLMHMAWVSGKATVALFGSSRSDWSRPLGSHSICLNSADMECGECMLSECKFGDVRCLTRFTPKFVFNKAQELLEK